MFKSFLIFTIALVSISARADFQDFNLSGNRHALIEVESRDATQPWLVYAPGSNCGLSDSEAFRPLQALASTKAFNILVINKAGIARDGTCRKDEFNASSIRENRIQDIEAVVAAEVPKAASLIYFGESEGGYIIPQIANEDPRSRAIILQSAGTRSWIEEEIHATPDKDKTAVRELLYRDVVGHPVLDQFFRGWTFAQLDSYHSNASYNQLARATVPVLMLNGEKDTCTWVQGTQDDVTSMQKSNITFDLLKDADHGLHCKDTACSQDQLDQAIKDAVTQFAKDARLN